MPIRKSFILKLRSQVLLVKLLDETFTVWPPTSAIRTPRKPTNWVTTETNFNIHWNNFQCDAHFVICDEQSRMDQVRFVALRLFVKLCDNVLNACAEWISSISQTTDLRYFTTVVFVDGQLLFYVLSISWSHKFFGIWFQSGSSQSFLLCWCNTKCFNLT